MSFKTGNVGAMSTEWRVTDHESERTEIISEWSTLNIVQEGIQKFKVDDQSRFIAFVCSNGFIELWDITTCLAPVNSIDYDTSFLQLTLSSCDFVCINLTWSQRSISLCAVYAKRKPFASANTGVDNLCVVAVWSVFTGALILRFSLPFVLTSVEFLAGSDNALVFTDSVSLFVVDLQSEMITQLDLDRLENSDSMSLWQESLGASKMCDWRDAFNNQISQQQKLLLAEENDEQASLPAALVSPTSITLIARPTVQVLKHNCDNSNDSPNWFVIAQHANVYKIIVLENCTTGINVTTSKSTTAPSSGASVFVLVSLKIDVSAGLEHANTGRADGLGISGGGQPQQSAYGNGRLYYCCISPAVSYVDSGTLGVATILLMYSDAQALVVDIALSPPHLDTAISSPLSIPSPPTVVAVSFFPGLGLMTRRRNAAPIVPCGAGFSRFEKDARGKYAGSGWGFRAFFAIASAGLDEYGSKVYVLEPEANSINESETTAVTDSSTLSRVQLDPDCEAAVSNQTSEDITMDICKVTNTIANNNNNKTKMGGGLQSLHRLQAKESAAHSSALASLTHRSRTALSLTCFTLAPLTTNPSAAGAVGGGGDESIHQDGSSGNRNGGVELLIGHDHRQVWCASRTLESTFAGPMYPVGFRLLDRQEPYFEAEDELDTVVPPPVQCIPSQPAAKSSSLPSRRKAGKRTNSYVDARIDNETATQVEVAEVEVQGEVEVGSTIPERVPIPRHNLTSMCPPITTKAETAHDSAASCDDNGCLLRLPAVSRSIYLASRQERHHARSSTNATVALSGSGGSGSSRKRSRGAGNRTVSLSPAYSFGPVLEVPGSSTAVSMNGGADVNPLFYFLAPPSKSLSEEGGVLWEKDFKIVADLKIQRTSPALLIDRMKQMEDSAVDAARRHVEKKEASRKLREQRRLRRLEEKAAAEEAERLRRLEEQENASAASATAVEEAITALNKDDGLSETGRNEDTIPCSEDVVLLPPSFPDTEH